jgi:hypothetical protein
VLEAPEEVETAAGIRALVVVEVVEVDGRAAAAVDHPWTPAQRVLVDRLDVHRHEGHVVSEPNLDVRPQVHAIDDRGRLDMRTEVELVGIDARAGAHARAEALR